MNTKLVAILMSIIMAVAALVIAVPGASDAGEGDKTDPYYIIGTPSNPAILYQSDTDGLKARMDFNQAAYTLSGNPTFKYSINGTSYTNIAVGTETNVNSGGAKVTIDSTSDAGIYELTMKYNNREKTNCSVEPRTKDTTDFGPYLTMRQAYISIDAHSKKRTLVPESGTEWSRINTIADAQPAPHAEVTAG